MFDLVFHLLRRPGQAARSFRQNPPWISTLGLMCLIILGIGAFLTGFLHGRPDPTGLGGVLTVTGGMIGLAVFSVFCFGLHLNGRILDGSGRFIHLFVSLLFLLCCLFLFIRLPLWLLVSFLPPMVAGSWNLWINLTFAVLLLFYTLRLFQILYQLDPGRAVVSLLLMGLYILVFAAVYRLSGPLIHFLTQ